MKSKSGRTLILQRGVYFEIKKQCDYTAKIFAFDTKIGIYDATVVLIRHIPKDKDIFTKMIFDILFDLRKNAKDKVWIIGYNKKSDEYQNISIFNHNKKGEDIYEELRKEHDLFLEDKDKTDEIKYCIPYFYDKNKGYLPACVLTINLQTYEQDLIEFG